MWIASPSVYEIVGSGAEEMLRVYNDGNLTMEWVTSSSSTNGFRPIICLKQNTQLIYQEDKNVYMIYHE